MARRRWNRAICCATTTSTCVTWETSEADVERLLQSFWTRMQGSEEKAAALALFELEGAVDYPAIKLRYRQLVSQHHPDRGGSTARLQSINKAMEILQRYYSRP